MAEREPIRFWRSLAERDRPDAVAAAGHDEFGEPPDSTRLAVGRRDFLRAAGFAFSGAAIGCGRAPVQQAVPFLVQSDDITPGRAYHYASTCGACMAGCGILVKNRDGRPIKLEGNDEHPLSRGGLCAVGQASILGVYDSHRLRAPRRAGDVATWEAIDAEVGVELRRLEAEGGVVRLLTGTVHSPTLRTAIDAFLARFADARHIVSDGLSASAILDAHERTHGVRRLPRYRFDRASVVVGIEADFLGTWIAPVEHTAAFRSARNVNRLGTARCHHVQFEAGLTVTGSKADKRYRVAPGASGVLLSHIASRLASLGGSSFAVPSASSPIPSAELDALVERLWAARGRALVVCGTQSVPEQVVCNVVNHLLDGYGETVDLDRGSRQRQGNDRDVEALLGELERGEVDALLIAGPNPVYERSSRGDLAEWIARIPMSVAFVERPDETSSNCRFVCPTPHYLESWGDGQPVDGVFTLQQPCVRPIGDTRPLLETLGIWNGNPRSAHDQIRATWRAILSVADPTASGSAVSSEDAPADVAVDDSAFEAAWTQAVHDGFHDAVREMSSPAVFDAGGIEPIGPRAQLADGEYALRLYAKGGLLDGSHAYNAWLQELPDPVTKITWDNYACLSPQAAATLGVEGGDVVRLTPGDGGAPLELPVVVQPGQHDRAVCVALGYGGVATERFAGLGPQWLERRDTVGSNGRVGVNVAPWYRFIDGALDPAALVVTVEPTGRVHPLAATQTHHTITVPEHLAPRGAARRPTVHEVALGAVGTNASADGQHEPHGVSMWGSGHAYTGHRWAMAIDLDACTGCSACVVACQVENNIPVVGKDEVRRRREMHWMRIDRYYSGDDDRLEVAHQPMLCQHCENAPCETVCPVLATVHSAEGLNQQIYNRCVGTRYCANNCPYKVRRFNWFDYPHDDQMENLVLNPDVTVRSRGVMEKCSFCVQRIQEARMEARREGVALTDGAVRPACEQSCPAKAIVFGDVNDAESRVSQAVASSRAYRVLEELNVRPSVSYLAVVRDEISGGEADHG